MKLYLYLTEISILLNDLTSEVQYKVPFSVYRSMITHFLLHYFSFYSKFGATRILSNSNEIMVISSFETVSYNFPYKIVNVRIYLKLKNVC